MYDAATIEAVHQLISRHVELAAELADEKRYMGSDKSICYGWKCRRIALEELDAAIADHLNTQENIA